MENNHPNTVKLKWRKINHNRKSKCYFWRVDTNETMKFIPDYFYIQEKEGILQLDIQEFEKKTAESSQTLNLIDDWQKVIDHKNNIYWWNVQTDETVSSIYDLCTFQEQPKKIKPNGFFSSMPKLSFFSSTPDAKKIRSNSENVHVSKLTSNQYKENPLLLNNKVIEEIPPSNWKLPTGRFNIKLKKKNKKKKELPSLNIGYPSHIQHLVHVTFDSKEIRYSGKPSDWLKNCATVPYFGVSLESCPKLKIDHYSNRIPAILVFLKQSLIRMDGYRTEGLFRISSNQNDWNSMKDKINRFGGAEALKHCFNPHIPAALIKHFFHELKPNLLNCIPQSQVEELSSYESLDLFAKKKDELIPEPNQSTLLWLLDLLIEVSEHKSSNKMSLNSLAAVFSPNLYNFEVTSLDSCLYFSQKVINFVQLILIWRVTTTRKFSI